MMNPGFRKSTWLWLHVLGIMLNFNCLVFMAIAKVWVLMAIHVICMYISYRAVNSVMAELDEKEKEDVRSY